MVAWVPAGRFALKVAPLALEVGRQLDKQLRPHVLAYRFARDVDGFVARWSAGKEAHWVVFPRLDGAPLKAFPPLPAGELELADRELDRSTLRHHSELPEARIKQRASAVKDVPVKAVGKLRRGGGDTV
jgi:hypothetical protein